MSRKIRMYVLKYDLLKLELEEIEEKVKNVEKDWYTTFGKYFVKEVNEIQEENINTSSKPVIEKKNKIKKLYKRLAIKLHPDKGGDKKKFNNFKKLYDENNLIELIKLANNNNIPYEYDEEDIELLEKNCKEIEEKIKFKLNTVIYQYYYGTDEEKKAAINTLKVHYNIDFLKM